MLLWCDWGVRLGFTTHYFRVSGNASSQTFLASSICSFSLVGLSSQVSGRVGLTCFSSALKSSSPVSGTLWSRLGQYTSCTWHPTR